MNIFKRFISAFKSLGSTDETYTLDQLIDFLGLSGTPKDALSEATYFACLKVLGEGIGKLPLKLLAYTEKNGVRTARDHPLYNVLNRRPNPYMTASVFWNAVEMARNHHGNAYVLITGAGSNTQLWILESELVQLWKDDAKLLGSSPDLYYIYTKGGKRYSFSSEEIMHFKTSNTLDGVAGVAVRDQLKTTIGGMVQAQDMVNKMYETGFTAKAVLQYTGNLSDENVQKFVKGIENYSTGQIKNQGIENIIPVPVGATLTPLNVKLADNQFIEVKQYSALQIASAFGIKPYQIGDYTKSSYASAEAQQLSFYVDTLLFIIKQYEEEITYKLLSEEEVGKQGLHAKFNTAVMLRADQKTQIETLAKAVQSFIYTPNEARNLLDLEDKEDGDQLLGNGSNIPLSYAGKQYMSRNTTPDPDPDEDKPERKGEKKDG